MKSPIIITAVFVVLVCLLAVGQAKDYKEMLGPYEVSFTLPDDMASTVELNKSATTDETLDGTQFTMYLLALLMPKTQSISGDIVVFHYDQPTVRDLDSTIEGMKSIGKDDGYTSFNTAHRIIDGHPGVVVDCLGSSRYSERYHFAYQPDSQTVVRGVSYMNWNTGTLPFLKSLHVEAAK